MESFGNSSSDQLKKSTGIKKVWAYIVNNGFMVPLQIDSIKGIVIIVSTVLHYFVGIFAFCLFAATLFELNRFIRVKVRSLFKKGTNQVSLVKKILGTIKNYGVLILPMIIIAAFLETYIADTIFTLFRQEARQTGALLVEGTASFITAMGFYTASEMIED